MSDELTSRLTRVGGVRVLSSGATREYRNTTKPRNQIGRELGVDYLLAGHVRWHRAQAQRVRVTVELVRASDESSVWSQQYDAATEDLFTVEGQIGEQVAGALEVVLEDRERRAISTRPTENFDAYTYFLRGEALRTAVPDALNSRQRALVMYERAVALDPKFALAFARLAQTHGEVYWANTDRTTKRLALMRAAAETALRLDPGLPEGHLAIGYYYYRGLHDYDRALAEFAAGLQRNSAQDELLVARGAVLRRQGRYVEAARDLARAASSTHARQKRRSSSRRGTPGCATILPRYATSSARSHSIPDGRGCTPTWRCTPLNGGAMWRKAGVSCATAWDPAMRGAPWIGCASRRRCSLAPSRWGGPRCETRRSTTSAATRRSSWCGTQTGRYGTANRRAVELTPTRRGRSSSGVSLGSPARPGRGCCWLSHTRTWAAKPTPCAKARAAEILPVSRDANDGADLQIDLAYVETLVGELDAAAKRLAYLLTIPSDISIPLLRVDPMWDSLRGNTRSQRLVATAR